MRSVVAFAAVLLCAVPTSASADQAAYFHYARGIMSGFARCIINNEPKLARKFVLMSSDRQLSKQEFERVADWRCLGFLGGKLTMQPFVYRAALAQELIRKDFAGSSVLSAATVPALDWSVAPLVTVDRKTGRPLNAVQREAEQKKHDYVVAMSFVGRLGECVVRTDPAAALTVLNTKSDAAEFDAMRALAPRIASCVRAGQTLKFNRTNLRDALALSYYRLAMAASAMPQAKAAL